MNKLVAYQGLGGSTAWINGIEKFPAFLDYVFSDCNFANSIDSWAKNPIDALLLHGDYGTGKSELAKRLPVYMEEHFQYAGSFHVLDCADPKFCPQKHIIGRLNYSGIWGTPYFVLEEADHLSLRNQVSLRHIIEKYSDLLNIVLTTNELNKIDKGVRDRATLIKVNFPKLKDWVPYVRTQLGSNSRKLISDAKILKVLEKLGCSSGRDVYRAIRTLKSELKIS